MFQFKAGIFDMDGTILNSYKAWENAFCVKLKEYGILISKEEFIELYKMTDEETKNFLSLKIKSNDLSINVEEVYSIIFKTMEYEYEHNILPKPGVVACIEALHKKGVKLCVATLTHNGLAQKALQRIGIMQYIGFVITGDDVGKSKEFPDIYLEASRRMSCAPNETAVFEDSLSAAKTASQAGFIVHGVFDQYQTYDFPEIFSYSYVNIYDWLQYYAII